MYHVSAQGIDERMINVHYYYYSVCEGDVIGVTQHLVVIFPAYLVQYL